MMIDYSVYRAGQLASAAESLAIGKRKECLCMVDREADHPLWPAGYTPVDGFFRELGFCSPSRSESRGMVGAGGRKAG